MLLHRITLEDFGAYRGKQSLELTTKENRPIVLIGGYNGCGKTTLLDAIQLVLYGPRANCSARGNQGYEPFLRDSINRQVDPAQGASITLEFSITVEDVERQYKVIRNWRLSGKTVKEYLYVEVDGAFSGMHSANWPDHVEEIIPFELSSLFFFDGEKIEALADPEQAGSVIRSAVQSLLGVSTVEQLRSDLSSLQRRQVTSVKNQEAVAALKAQAAEHEAADRAVEVEVQKRSQLKTALARLEKDLGQIERRFEREGGSLFERFTELDSERKRVSGQIELSNAALVALAAGPLPLLMLRDQLETLGKQATQESESAQAAHVVDVLQDRDKWVLSLIAESLPSTTRTAVSRKLTADRKKRAAAAVVDHGFELPHDAVAQFSALNHALEHDQARGKELLAKSAELREELDILVAQIESVPDKTRVEEIIKERRKVLDDIAVARMDFQRSTAMVDELRRRREQLGIALERARQARAQSEWDAEVAQRLYDYAARTRETLAKFSDVLLLRHIDRLEVAVLQSFTELMRKRGLVRDLRIDPKDYTLMLSDADGEPIDLGRLSAGERQLLAISLLAGLMKVAGNRLPSVIDTPLGRLDSKHREHLVDRYFPKAGRQVLLLSTDEEIDEHLLGRLKPAISHSYMLVHDDSKFTTTVTPGYWWSTGAEDVA